MHCYQKFVTTLAQIPFLLLHQLNPVGKDATPFTMAVQTQIQIFIDIPAACLQCFDAAGWAAGTASGL